MAACGYGGNMPPVEQPSYGNPGMGLPNPGIGLPNPGPGLPNPGPDGGDCEDCVQVVKTTKKVRVPCHRNTYKQYHIKVPRQITEECPREVKWTDYECRTKQVPYQDVKIEERVKFQEQKYQVPVNHCVTKMVAVTKKEPRTIYVDVVKHEPRQENITKMETRTRQVKIKFPVSIPVTKYRTEQYQVPVQKSKTVIDKVNKTVFDTQIRTRCEPTVTYVTKEIPVYNVVARPPQPCPPQQDVPISGGSMAVGGASMAVGGAQVSGGAVAVGPQGGAVAVGGSAAVGGASMAVGGAQMEQGAVGLPAPAPMPMPMPSPGYGGSGGGYGGSAVGQPLPAPMPTPMPGYGGSGVQQPMPMPEQPGGGYGSARPSYGSAQPLPQPAPMPLPNPSGY